MDSRALLRACHDSLSWHLLQQIRHHHSCEMSSTLPFTCKVFILPVTLTKELCRIAAASTEELICGGMKPSLPPSVSPISFFRRPSTPSRTFVLTPRPPSRDRWVQKYGNHRTSPQKKREKSSATTSRPKAADAVSWPGPARDYRTRTIRR